MMEEETAKYKAVGISVLLHVVVFVLIASTGFFSKVSSQERKIDVVVYEAADVAGAEPAGATAAVSSNSIPSVEDIVLKKKNVILPQITEEYTNLPERKDPFREQQTEKGEVQNKNGTVAGTSTVDGNGKNDSLGDSKSNGKEAGGGAGPESGKSDGYGRNPSEAQRPKIPPKLLSSATPIYPDALRRQNIEGQVHLRLVVGSDGSVDNVEILQSSGYDAMDQAAVSVVYDYRFSPARNVYDEPVRCATTTTIHFKLD